MHTSDALENDEHRLRKMNCVFGNDFELFSWEVLGMDWFY